MGADGPSSRLIVAVLSLALLGAPSAGTTAPRPDDVPRTLASADSLAALPGSPARDRALKRWIEERASLADLVYLLRRSPGELGPVERILAETALKRTTISRPALRRRLIARLKRVDSKRARSAARDPAELEAVVAHPYASVFRVAALFPDSGDYRSYGRALLAGIRLGLAPAAGQVPSLELEAFPTGDDAPERAVAAFDSAADRAGAAIGELLSVPTLVLATAARYAGLPLVSPSATDESVGAMAPNVFQIGPSGFDRGLALAGAALISGPARIGVLLSSAAERSALALGFVTAAERAGAQVVWRDTYSPGNLNFREAVRAMMARQVELLLWDGDAREAEALLRQLARDRVSVHLCGGEGLSPEQHHAETRALLEGVRYVGEEWRLQAPVATRLDSAMAAEDLEGNASLAARGYLAGRLLRDAVQSGALCPEEVTAYLRARVAAEPYQRNRGFIDPASEGATLPVFTVSRGKVVGP